MPELRYELKSMLDNVPPFLEEMKETWAGFHLDDKTIFGLHLCLEEALVNAIKYGNKYDATLSVDVICRVETDRVELEITNRGPGFDFKSLPDPTVEENITKLRGRGIYLIRQYMDSTEFLDEGRTIKMVKLLKK